MLHTSAIMGQQEVVYNYRNTYHSFHFVHFYILYKAWWCAIMDETWSMLKIRSCLLNKISIGFYCVLLYSYALILCLKGARLRLKCDGTRAETRFRLSAKRTGPFNSAGGSVQSTTGSRGVRIGGSKAGHNMFRGSVKSTGCPLPSPVSPSLPHPCVTECHYISNGLYSYA